MVAVVSNPGLGLFGSTVPTQGTAGHSNVGRGRDAVFVNTATGNLIVQSIDDNLRARGLDVSLVRTYNSHGLMNDDNGDNWRLSVHQRVHGLTGTLNSPGSSIRKVFGDGREVEYFFDDASSTYVSPTGDGAHDTLHFDGTHWTWTDGSGRNTETYDASGRLITSRDADGNTIEYTYTGALLTQITDASGQTTHLDYAGGNLTAIRVVSDGVTQTLTRYSYDNNNRLEQVRVDLSPEDGDITDGDVYITTYSYDGASLRIASLTQSDGSSIHFTYDSQGRVESYTANDLGTTTLSYVTTSSLNGLATEVEITSPLGAVTTLFNGDDGRLTGLLGPEVNGVRQEVRYVYDAVGNLISVVEDPAGLNRVTRFDYDDRGNLVSSRDSAGNTVSRTYSENNQVLTETRFLVPDPDGDGSDTATEPLTTRYVYDGEQHLRFTVSAEGRVTEHRYNAIGERVTTLTYANALYSYAAFAETDLIAWASAQDQTALQRVDYTYDFRGQLQSRIAYSATDVSGAGAGTPSITRFVYDQRGQLLQTIEARGAASTPNPSTPDLPYATTYTYDGLGRMLSATQWRSDGGLTTTLHAYDDASRLTTTTLANGLVSTRAYDRAGNLLSVVNGVTGALGTTHYAYDTEGRLRLETDPNGNREHYFYDDAGRRIGEVDGDGTLTELVYDPTGRLIKTIRYATRLDSATLASLVDASGNPVDVSIVTLRAAANGLPAQNRIERSVYSAAGRLVYAIDAAGAVTEFIYDGVGRITEEVRYAEVVTIPVSTATFSDGDLSLPGQLR